MAQEPWDIRTDDSRQEDTVITYIILCEDGFHEPEYFNSFQIEKKLRVSAIGRFGQRNQNFLKTIEHCESLGLVETVDGVDKLKEGITENIWCVYDRDENTKQPNAKNRDDFDFNNAIKSATDAGLKIAWSNDSFELWVLLHFENISHGVKLSGEDIYRRLTVVFQNLNIPDNDLAPIVSQEGFYYKKHLKTHFRSLVLPLLKTRTMTALKNSTSLASLYSGNTKFHDRNPCTMVHTLVLELLAFHEGEE